MKPPSTPGRLVHAVSSVLLTIFAVGVVARAQTPSDPAAAAPAITPTVTKETGDTGGKFFGRVPDPAKTRHYFIAAEPVLWNFAPEGADPVCGRPLPASLLLNRVSWKVHYVQYADADFTARVLPEPRLGQLGPVLRGVVGETIEVTFLNRTWLPLSMHPHGVRYDNDSEGSYYRPVPGRGAAVAPGARYTYVWQLDEASGPRPDEPSSKAWLYHSHVAGDEETNLGAIGFLIVTDPARARADGTPKDVDREMAALFMIFDESKATGDVVEEPDEIPAGTQPAGAVQRTWAEVQQIVEEHERYTINGLVFGNLHGLDMNAGERVRWYLFGLGSEDDFHTAHWHGLRVLEDGRRRTDTVELLPGTMKVADMIADNPGQWLFHCHVAEHMTEGMFARVTVHAPGAGEADRAPEVAFFGMPQALRTLRFTTAELSPPREAGAAPELFLSGEVTAPDPLPVARTTFAIAIGGKRLVVHPDSSGIAADPEGLLLVKNLSPVGNGNVRGGRVDFEFTLKGAGWLAALREAGALGADGKPAPAAHLAVTLEVGGARHHAGAVLSAASGE